MNRKRKKPVKMDMDMVRLIEKFHSEDRCREYLENLRWPEGVRCLRCKSDRTAGVKDRDQHECAACGYQFSVKAGTIFHDTHLPLWKWFLTAYMMIEAKKGVSANQVKRTIGVSYKTAWRPPREVLRPGFSTVS